MDMNTHHHHHPPFPTWPLSFLFYSVAFSPPPPPFFFYPDNSHSKKRKKKKKKMLVRRGGGMVVLMLMVGVFGGMGESECERERSVEKKPRPHSVSIVEFGAVGDGKTVNTLAFQNAIFYLKSFADKGGAQLYIPSGRWLTFPFNLTSHLTIFLEKDAILIASPEVSYWQVVDPLPSYGRGLDLPGRRYLSLFFGSNLTDVVITGDNGVVDGQGGVWWRLIQSGLLEYSRPHLVEFVGSEDIVISNLTFLNPPAIALHPVYCSGVLVQNVTVTAAPGSPSTIGVVPDSSDHVCIEDSTISTGGDSISLKSGWDEYGISYGRPTANVHIRRVVLESSAGAGLAFGSEMSGGISDILAEKMKVANSSSAIKVTTAKGRGGYVERVLVTEVEMETVGAAVVVAAETDALHPDEMYDPEAVPIVREITLTNLVGANIRKAGQFSGIQGAPFTSLCLINITLSPAASSSWSCADDVWGFSEKVSPRPCPSLCRESSPRGCFSIAEGISEM